MSAQYYYLTVTHTFDDPRAPHASYTVEFGAKSWGWALRKSRGILREQQANSDKGKVIAASLSYWGSGKISCSAHPSGRVPISKTFQPCEWA